MTGLESAILGLIQGLTEFLPVSSSGHIELGKEILGVHVEKSLLFSVVVHAATALSTIVVFRKDIANIFKGIFQFKWNESTQYASKIILSMIPVIIVGLLWESEIEKFFSGKILLVGSMLIFTGILLGFTHYSKPKTGEVSYLKSIIIGIAQAIAILPGISRSGATISTGLILGIEKEVIAKFSFLMVLVPILGAAAKKTLDFIELSKTTTIDINYSVLGIGFITAFITGIFACTWMIKLVKRGKLIYFAIYCAIAGLTAVLYALVNGL